MKSKVDAAVRERDAALKAASESAAKVAEANRLQAEAIKLEEEFKKKAAESALLADALQERVRAANHSMLNITRERDELLRAHNELVKAAGGSDKAEGAPESPGPSANTTK